MHLPEDLPHEDLVALCAADASAEILDYVVRLSGQHGRAGAIVNLRMRAAELGRSALAEDQVRSVVCMTAADDLAWGRPAFRNWMERFSDADAASAAKRAAVRERVPAAVGEADAAAPGLVRELSSRCLARAADAFEATLALPDHLEAAARLQWAAWDDPRLEAPSAIRAVMRSSAEHFRREALRLRPPYPAGRLRRTVLSGEAWRRLTRWRGWLGASGR